MALTSGLACTFGERWSSFVPLGKLNVSHIFLLDTGGAEFVDCPREDKRARVQQRVDRTHPADGPERAGDIAFDAVATDLRVAGVAVAQWPAQADELPGGAVEVGAPE